MKGARGRTAEALARGCRDITGAASRAGRKLDSALEFQQEQTDAVVKGLLDRALQHSVEKVLRAFGASLKRMLKPPYASRWMERLADQVFAGAWPDLKETIEESIMETAGRARAKEKRRQLFHWARRPRLQFGAWNCVRARVLHSLKPADGNKLRSVAERDGVALGVILLKMSPAFGTNVLVFILLFVLIDKSDESQLVGYILSFKSFQFISGVFSASSIAYAFLSCLQRAADGDPASCAAMAPALPLSIALLEVARVALLAMSGLLLVGGRAFGGPEELLALEQVRVDKAMGKLGGRAAAAAAPGGAAPSAGRGYVPLRAEAAPPSHEEVQGAISAARIRYGVQRRRGGFLPYFLLYDAVVLVLIAAALAANAAVATARGRPSWLLWCYAYYAKLTWALLSLPYLVFTVPLLGRALHRARPTGYDKEGQLVPMLSSALMKAKMARDQQRRRAAELQAERLSVARDDDGAAGRSSIVEKGGLFPFFGPATKARSAVEIQRIHRGRITRRRARARFLRHAVSLTTPVGLFVSASSIEQWFINEDTDAAKLNVLLSEDSCGNAAE